MLQKISRGDVYYYDFGHVYSGSIEGKRRPCVVVSNNMGNTHGTTVIVAPITTRELSSCKSWQVHFKNEERSQIVLLEQLRVVNISDLEQYLGRLSESTMKDIDIALAIELDLNIVDREIELAEFLRRLDDTLLNITNSHLNNYDKKINEILSKTLNDASVYRHDYDKLCEDIINKISELINNNVDLNTSINEIKMVFNKNAENIDKILTSLIALYKDVNFNQNQLTPVISKDSNENNVNSEQSIDNKEKIEVKSSGRKSKYSLEFAKIFIKDYYTMNRQEFMKKYDLTDIVMVNNRMITMKNILKRNNIDYRHVKDNVTVYNINDLSEEEKQQKFAKYLKSNDKLAVVETNADVVSDIKKKEPEPEIHVAANQNLENRTFGLNKGSKQKNRLERFEYSVENCLAFINDWNTTSFESMCKKYNMTAKQMTNRKYLICRWLLNNNVEFKVSDKRKK